MRTFIAIELPGYVRSGIEPLLAQTQDHLAVSGLARAVRWTSPSKLHLTLRFLGETDAAQRRSICADLQDAIPRHQPFNLAINDLGCFPNRHAPRVIWLGIGGALERLTALQTDSERAAVQAGFEPERRSFSPHLTIGRAKRGLSKAEQRRIGEAMHELELARENLNFEVAELVLMQSVLKPSGGVYSVLDRFALSGVGA